jgi:hypothetical protein
MTNQEAVAKYRNTLKGRFVNLCSTAKSRAAKKKLDFSITTEDLEELYYRQSGICAISGLKMTTLSGPRHRSNSFVMSLDRIDSEKGYTKDNIQLVCWQANRMKDCLTCDEFKFWIKTISSQVLKEEERFNDYPEREYTSSEVEAPSLRIITK